MEDLKLTKWQYRTSIREGLRILSLDCGPEAKQNTLSKQALEELNQVLDVNLTDHPRVMVIRSSKFESFCAGMDVDEIREIVNDPSNLKQLLNRAHEILMKIRQAPYPIIALIAGECLGGGLELAMACHYRFVIDHPKTRLGLPETQLGIIPGFGGTQILPRLVGMQNAIKVIVGGKKLSAKEAKQYGLADSLVDKWEALAIEELDFGTVILDFFLPVKRKVSFLERLPFGKKLVCSMARKATLKATKGVYPAPLLALEAVCASSKSLSRGLNEESDLFVKAANTPEAKNLIDLFFVRKDARKATPLEAKVYPLDVVGVIGAGVMGSTIAYAALTAHNKQVYLHDTYVPSIHKAVRFIEDELAREVKKGKMIKGVAEETRNRLTVGYGETFHSLLSRCDIVIEAIVEDMAEKHKLFTKLEELTRPGAILVSNTSSLLPSEIASVLLHPENFCAMHFFNPAHKMDLVEIAGIKQTNPEIIAKVLNLTRAMGKTPVVLNKECVGLLVNRVMTQYLMQSIFNVSYWPSRPNLWMLDQAFEMCGMMMGPFKTLDLIGFDTGAHVMKMMQAAYPKSLPDLKDFKIADDKSTLGTKTGKGFYIWKNGKPVKPNYEFAKRLDIMPKKKHSLHGEIVAIRETILSKMWLEAMDIYENGIASIDMIDLSLILGGGMMPNRRGVIGRAEH
ncbi:MAG: 3-hydroxyacyl-CoA dehydrogenase / enoyl-CoA hydratase / 3-hydroxybutyryl-CoA epimerase [Parcubacteria group bacterium Gr01-1014_3]|nr:MAG: 3-hydroxyacyl-CoA dehydrogenase / enoyl-CoA hydratase / 3-hydroxybutyryl-CoA epimerase [Parcubacteria group bacterium Gr01-1014_3]